MYFVSFWPKRFYKRPAKRRKQNGDFSNIDHLFPMVADVFLSLACAHKEPSLRSGATKLKKGNGGSDHKKRRMRLRRQCTLFFLRARLTSISTHSSLSPTFDLCFYNSWLVVSDEVRDHRNLLHNESCLAAAQFHYKNCSL